MVETQIPRWLAALDEKKPYIEVLDGEKLPGVSPYFEHGQGAVEIIVQLRAWAGDHGSVETEVRFYLLHPDGRWSSLLPDVAYASYAHLPKDPIKEWQRPRIAPDIAVEIVSPAIARGGRSAKSRRISSSARLGPRGASGQAPRWLHRSGGSVEELDARGAWVLAPFDDLILDWEKVFR